jgi:hypothetical protein
MTTGLKIYEIQLVQETDSQIHTRKVDLHGTNYQVLYSPVPVTVLIRMGILLFKLAKIPWGEPFE